MSDPKRHPVSRETEDDALARLKQIDALLEDGLDKYFAARYEDAIHLWTRVLFLDRSHARARAYIERARTALAELQRRSDELLQTTRDLLAQGQADAARRLLTAAVETTGDDVQASALRVSIERLERAGRRQETDASVAGDVYAVEIRSVRTGRRKTAWVVGGAALLAIGAAAIAIAVSSGTDPLAGRPPVAVAPVVVKLPVLSSSEVALVRARTDFARGRLSEALRALDRVPADSPDRPAADQFRIEIQRLLMASVRSSTSPTSTEPVRR